MCVSDDSLSIKITKSSKILRLFVLIFLQSSVTVNLVSYTSLIEFEDDYRFTFTYLPSFHIFVQTFGFFLCRLFLDQKDSTGCIDATIINEQSDELSRRIGNILFILGNNCCIIYV